jgi:non-specific serine/threonine protein kinase
MSPDKDNEYFSDGLTEEIITDLSHIHDLLVISRSSAMTFKGTNKKIGEIAKEVNVHYVLEGSVRKAGNNLRITAQLIDSKTDLHLWAEKYSGTLDDVFDIQEKVSRSIVDSLKLTLSPKENKKLAERPIDNVLVYEYYLKAIGEITKFSEDAINHSLRYLQNAINISGDNPQLYAGMAFAYYNLVNIGAKQEDYLLKAEEYAKKALELDLDSALAYVILGYVDWFREKTLQSLPRFKKALDINPNEIFALAGILTVYHAAGKLSDAVPYTERIMQIDPLSFPPNWYNGAQYYYDGKYDLAHQAWQRLYELHPENPFSQFMYALILVYTDQKDKAIPIIDRNAKANPGNVLTKLGLILKYALQGDKEKIFQEITPDFQKSVRRDYSFSHILSTILSLANHKKEALYWLENAIKNGFINFPFLAEFDPFLENIRKEGRFKKLMERVKVEWENFEV